MAQDFDLVVVGGGPGGYVAAIRASQLGMKTACVEKLPALGGTCLNVGCIPSKALLSASEKFHEAAHGGLKQFGIKAEATLDLTAMQKHKSKVVTANTKGIEFLFKKNKIEWIKGEATLAKDGVVKVGNDSLKGKQIIWATGSEPVALPDLPFDEERVLSSTGGLALSEVPKKLIVVGGGYIGLELGCVWSRLGAEVVVVEFLDRILPGMDGEISKTFQPLLEKQGLTFKLGTKVEKVATGKAGVKVTLAAKEGGATEEVEADAVLVSVGRRANPAGADSAGVKLDDHGRIDVDSNFATSVPNVYAIGDVIKGPMLAHKAEEEGVALVERLAGGAGVMHYHNIPGVVYTEPEAASIGESEESLKEKGIAYKVGKFPYMANGRARAMGATDGFVKVLADKETDRLLGAHILGADAGALIHEVGLVMAFHGSAEDLARTSHAHPTLNEIVKEAALATGSGALHI